MNGSIPTGSAVRLVDPARAVQLPAPPGVTRGAEDTDSLGMTVAAAPRLESPRQAEPGQPLAGAVAQIKEFVQTVRRELQFEVDEGTGRTVVTVRDSETDEVIRQIPSEEVLKIAARLEEVNGVLFRERA